MLDINKVPPLMRSLPAPFRSRQYGRSAPPGITSSTHRRRQDPANRSAVPSVFTCMTSHLI